MSRSYVTWKAFYSVGCKELGHQHRVLLGIINDLYAAVDDEAEPQVILALLDRLAQYTLTHFEREEELMRQIHFADYAAHKMIHDAMKAKTAQLRQNWKATQGAEVLIYLKNWWVNHICGRDKEYAAVLAPMASSV